MGSKILTVWHQNSLRQVVTTKILREQLCHRDSTQKLWRQDSQWEVEAIRILTKKMWYQDLLEKF